MNRKSLIHIFPAVLAALLMISYISAAGNSQDQKKTDDVDYRTGEEIPWQVISGGATDGTSDSYKLLGTVAQTAIGVGESENFHLSHGFWFSGGGPCDCEPGEVNETPPINILDIVYLINYKYKEGPDPAPYPVCSGDPNCDCTVNILDIVYLINYKYKDGPLPCNCEQWTGDCGWPLRR
jgi:hypothetical protein